MNDKLIYLLINNKAKALGIYTRINYLTKQIKLILRVKGYNCDCIYRYLIWWRVFIKKCLLTLFMFLGFSSFCFAEPPYILNKMKNGWTKTVTFDISEYENVNSKDWKGEAYAYEAANYKGEFVGYILAIVNNKDQECYYSLIADRDIVYDMLRHYQTNFIWKEEFTTLATEMGDFAITKMYEDKDGKFWKLYGDCLSLTVLLDHDSKFYRGKVLPKFYDCVKNQAGDDVEITFEDFLEKIPLFMDTYLQSVDK